MNEKSSRKKLYMIGNAHIDPMWLWRWTEGMAEIKATFRSVLDRLEEYPDFIFTQSSAAFYRWIQENDPEMFREIKRRVQEGRWVITGGWWVEPDCNMPCGESFARQALYAQKYFMEQFGRPARTGYCIDSFGHSAMLPRMLERSGLSSYVMMRPDPHEMELPANSFIWRGSDGCEIPVFKIKGSYRSFDRNFISILDDTRHYADEKRADMMCFYGVGNHGGGPTKGNIETILKRKDKDGLKFSSPDDFFDELDMSVLPVVEGPLHPHAVGCYSAYSEIKSENRRAESHIRTAEFFDTFAGAITGCEIHTGIIEEAWEKILFAQFHDSLCGCCIEDACRDTVKLLGEAWSEADRLLCQALLKLCWQIDTMPSKTAVREKKDWLLWESGDFGTPLIIFNPTGFRYRGLVRVNKPDAAVFDDDGRPLVTQAVEAPRCNEADSSDSLFIAELPPFGYGTYWLRANCPQAVKRLPTAEEDSRCLENQAVKAVFDPDGNLTELWDKALGRQILASPLSFTMLDDHDNDTWAHGVDGFYGTEIKFEAEKSYQTEAGPLRSVIRTFYRLKASSVRVDFILAEEGFLDMEIKTNIQDKRSIVRMCLPTTCSEPVCEYEAPYGIASAAVDGREAPMQRFIDIHDRHGGLTVLNDGRYSFSAKGSELKCILARTALTADHYGDRSDRSDGIYMDTETLFINFRLVPHGESWREQASIMAEQMHREPLLIIDTYHEGPLARMGSWISCDKNNVCIDVFKRAEDGGGYVLRMHESRGADVPVALELPCIGRKLSVNIKRHEIKTIYIPDEAEAPFYETTFLEEIPTEVKKYD